MSFLSMRGIVRRFGATVALDKVDFDVERGEVHALVGENGSGKSTLMRVLAGAIQPDAGEMHVNDVTFRPRNPMQARSEGVAMIHQELSLCGHTSVAENILLGMEMSVAGFVRERESARIARSALGKLGYGDLDVSRAVNRLPIGIRQIVEIARAVAIGSRIVILDEPTSSLAEADVDKLFDAIRVLRAEGHAIIYISHFLDEVKRIADRVTILRDGQNVATRNATELSSEEMITLMVGRTIETLYPRSKRPIGDSILEVKHLAGDVYPKNASFGLHRGEVLGIAGLNGAGRTELLRAIFGLDKVRKGEVRISTYVGPASPARRWKQGVGLVSEDRKLEGLALNMTVADNLTLTKLGHLGKAGWVSQHKQKRETNDWISRMDIRCREPFQPVGELSGGNQQKVAIARLLYHDTDVLMLDEPTRGIDVASKEQIYRLIDDLALQSKAILIVSSYLPELLGICDRIAVMHKGELGRTIAAAETNSETIMQEALGA